MTPRNDQRHATGAGSGIRLNRSRLGSAVAWAAVLLCAAGCGDSDEPEGPQTRTVSQTQDADFSSIQACISASENGDTCLVYSGTYGERIRFQGKAITVRSSAGPEKTIIDGREKGTVVTFDRSEQDDSVLQGFTITKGLAVSGEGAFEHGGGIRMLSAGPTIRDCIVLENRAEGDGGGIYCFSTGSRPEIENVIFQGNSAGGQGGALCVVFGKPDLTNCLFFGNDAASGGAISARYAAPFRLDQCTFAENTADQAWALYLKNAAVSAINTIFWNGASPIAAPILMDLDADLGLEGNTALSLSYLTLQGGTGSLQRTEACSSNPGRCFTDEGPGLQVADPLFAALPQGSPTQAFYLSQRGSGQPAQSPCVDAGDRTAEEAGMEEATTRTDGLADEGIVDLGYHYEATSIAP